MEGQRIARGVEDRTSIIRGRSCKDFQRSLAYSLYLLNDGRIGSRAEREYLTNERTKIQYEKLAGCIKTFKFNFSSDEEAIPVYHNEEQFASNINADDFADDFENQARESLLSSDTRNDSLNESILSSASVLSNRTEKVRQARNDKWSDDNSLICQSVATRQLAKGKSELLFKYKSCSICLCDFT